MSQFLHQTIKDGKLSPSMITPSVGMSKVKLVTCPPKYLSTRIANNVFMKNEPVDVERAMRQYARFIRLFKAMDVTVLEIPPVKGCQDQTYVANLFCAIKPYIVLAKFSAKGRDCEEKPGRRFFEQRGYTVIQPPAAFEGEADLIKWKDNTYFGGFGKFSDPESFRWIANKTRCEIIPIESVSDAAFHLDCSIHVIEQDHLLVNRGGISPKSFKTLEKLAKITVVPKEFMTTGATNMVKIPGNKKVFLSGAFFPEREKYQKAMEWLLTFGDSVGYTMIFLDIDQNELSGADISCCVGHLDF